MFHSYFEAVKKFRKRQKLSFKLRNLILSDIIEGLSKSAKGGKS